MTFKRVIGTGVFLMGGTWYTYTGDFDDDFDGSYYEAGYGSDLPVKKTCLFDYGISIIYCDSTLLGGESDTNINFQIMRTFSF